jgi:hypothetical protein
MTFKRPGRSANDPKVDVDNAYRLGAKERALAARLDKLTLRRKQVLAWLRRTIVSIGIGGASYAFMLGIMLLSVVYDREFEPVITFAFDAVIQHIGLAGIGKLLGTGGSQSSPNMTHVVLSLPAIIISAIVVGITLNCVHAHSAPANCDSDHKCTRQPLFLP